MTDLSPQATTSTDATPAAEQLATELTRISVLCGHRQIDVGVPSEASVAALLPELARLLLRNEFDEPADVPLDLTEQWTLSRVGQRPLDDNLSLSSAGVRDGDLLVLRTESTTEIPVIYDDVIEAIAGINAREFSSWSTRSARWMGAIGLPVAALAGVVALLLTAHTSPYRWVGLAFAAVGAAGFLLGAFLSVQRLRDVTVGALMTCASCTTAFAAGWLAVGPDRVALAFFLGFALAAIVAVISLRVSAGSPMAHLALISGTVLAALGALLQTLWGDDLVKTAAIMTVVAMFASFVGPRLTILLARLPIPTVPNVGEPLTDDDSDPAINVEPGVSAIANLAMPQSQALEIRAKAANSYLAGLVLGCATVAVVAATITAFPYEGRAHWQAILLALLASTAIASRGRLHRDLSAAGSMIGAGLAGAVALGVMVILANGWWMMVGFAWLLLLAAGSAYIGVVVARREHTPPVRRAGEILEYVMITVCVPLAAGIAGVYGLARGL